MTRKPTGLAMNQDQALPETLNDALAIEMGGPLRIIARAQRRQAADTASDSSTR